MLLNPYRFGGAGNYWYATLGSAVADNSLISGTVAVDADGNIYIAGQTAGVGGADLVVAKIDPSGELLWQRVMAGSGQDYARGIAVDSSGNVFVAAATDTSGQGLVDALLVKYDTNGVLQWQRTYGTTANDYGYQVAVSAAGDIFLAIATYLSNTGGGSGDISVLKLNSSGVVQWTYSIGGTNIDLPYALKLSSDGSIYVAGVTYSLTSLGQQGFLFKLSSAGAIQWQRSIGNGALNDLIYGISVSSAGAVYVCGTHGHSTESNNSFVARYESTGALTWHKSFGSLANEGGMGVHVNASGVYMVGLTSASGTMAIHLTKMDEVQGIVSYNKRIGTSTGAEQGKGITSDSDGNLVIVATTTGMGAGDFDLLALKLPPDGLADGTYGALSCADSTAYPANGVLVGTTPALTARSITFAAATPTLPDAAGTLTFSKTPI